MSYMTTKAPAARTLQSKFPYNEVLVRHHFTSVSLTSDGRTVYVPIDVIRPLVAELLSALEATGLDR